MHFYIQGQIYEREEIAKYLKKEGNAASSPVTREKIKNKALFPSIHVRNTIEHLVESGIIEGELADTWKERMAEKRESESMVKELTEKANSGDFESMYKLALCYSYGRYGFKKNKKEGYKWAKKSADGHNVKGMAFTGHCLLEGRGVAANTSEGLILVSLAAGQGSKGSCKILGSMYFKGRHGVQQNFSTAKYWFEKTLAGLEGEEAVDNRDITRSSVERARRHLKEIEALETADTDGAVAGNSDDDDDDGW